MNLTTLTNAISVKEMALTTKDYISRFLIKSTLPYTITNLAGKAMYYDVWAQIDNEETHTPRAKPTKPEGYKTRLEHWKVINPAKVFDCIDQIEAAVEAEELYFV